MRYLLIFLLVACGKVATPPTKTFIDPTLRPYLLNFLQEANKRGVEIKKQVSIKFGDLHDFDGFCFYSGEVVIDRTAWATLTPAKKEMLMTHELGHCLLSLTHDDAAEIMRENFWLLDWEHLRRHYLNDLFKASDRFRFGNTP